jgi:hypothetical protein
MNSLRENPKPRFRFKVGLLLNCNPSSFGMCDAIFRVNSFVGVHGMQGKKV